jgi:hypothetical protein
MPSKSPSPTYSFTNYRCIDGADYKKPAIWSAPWLKREQFTPEEVSQLEWILRQWGIKGNDPFAIPCDKFEGLAEVPLERWDVVDAAGVHVFSIWTYTDSGTIFEYGTTTVVGQIIQGGAEFTSPDVGAALEASRRAAEKADPDAPLPGPLDES